MITNWSLRNFKSIRKQTSIALAPLTIVAGPNSSGKSSVLQSMLMLSQTLRSTSNSTSIALNGPLVQLGTFEGLLSSGAEEQRIEISGVFRANDEFVRPGEGIARLAKGKRRLRRKPAVQFGEVGLGLVLGSGQSQRRSGQARLGEAALCRSVLSWHSCSASAPFEYISMFPSEDDDGPGADQQGPCAEGENSNDDAGPFYSWALDRTTEDSMGGLVATYELDHFLPQRLFVVRYDEKAMGALRAVENFLLGTTSPSAVPSLQTGEQRVPLELLASIDETHGTSLKETLGVSARPPSTVGEFAEFWRGLGSTSRAETVAAISAEPDTVRQELLWTWSHLVAEDPSPVSVKEGWEALPERLRGSAEELRRALVDKLVYLGPLRDHPRAIYPPSWPGDPIGVGTRGEATASILQIFGNDLVDCLPPEAFQQDAIGSVRTKEPLLQAVSRWLKYLGIAESVETTNRGRLGHELRIEADATGAMRDLPDVGVGVSQVLPIVVAGLLVPCGGTLLLEQPELHLHPKVQVLLTDFLIALALTDRQCIVETHSEHLVNRLRYRIASAVPPRAGLVGVSKVLFVERDEAGSSTFTDVAMNEYGAIANWPAGFFDQSQIAAESILRAASLKRNQKRGH